MSSPSPWGGWGTKLKVTSIVSQGLEQVRNLREDVEKSFDQVVTGALVLPEPTIENDTRREMTQEMLEPSTEEDEKGAQQLEKESEEQVREEKQQDDEGTDEEQEQEEKAEGQVETNPVVESMERDENALEKFSTSEDDKKRVLVLEKELQVRESQLLTSSTTVRELHDELDKTCRREVVAVERAQYLTGQLEQMQREVVKLTQLHRKSSRSQSTEVQTLLVELREKEEKLSALLEEGQALSMKQAQLEQRIRALRREKDEADERASKVEALAEERGDLLTKLKQKEEEAARVLQENGQLASTVDDLSSRVEKAEQRATQATQELEKMKRQVEQLTQVDATKDEEMMRLKATCESLEALNLEKMELQATLQVLHETVADVEKDAARREEMARAKIAEWKRKWQDAVARVDMLGQSVSEATQPLLRQISALHEQQRTRQESWKTTEKALEVRLEEATEKIGRVEQERVELEEQVHGLERIVEEKEAEVTKKELEVALLQEAEESAKNEAQEWRRQVEALQLDLAEMKEKWEKEVEAKEEAQTRVKDAEKMLEKVETSSRTRVQAEEILKRETQLRKDLEWHRQELQRLKSARSAPVSLENSSGEVWSEASILTSTLETTMVRDSFCSTSGNNTSILQLNQLQQRIRLREGENRMLKQQVEAMEGREKQLKDEIVRLSTRNTVLESNEAKREQMEGELTELKQHQVVLLELFGEKEEQVEELQAEVKELKAFYRKQLDALATHHEQ